MDKDAVRETLETLTRQHGSSYARLSKLLGRNPAYVQQFIKRGTPAKLEEEDRRRLASFFGVSESLLGGPVDPATGMDFVRVPKLDVGASAGSGALNDLEQAIGHYGFDARWLRGLAGGRLQDLSIIRVSGDSMAPTLVDGDDVLVDRSDIALRLRDGIYVLRHADALLVKRLALNPADRTLTIASDNPAYPTWSDCPLASVDVIGRVVWAGRRFA